MKNELDGVVKYFKKILLFLRVSYNSFFTDELNFDMWIKLYVLNCDLHELSSLSYPRLPLRVLD